MVIEQHAYTVAANTWTTMENDGRAGLLEVCDKGAKCREEVEKSVTEIIKSEWEKVVEMLEASILSATS